MPESAPDAAVLPPPPDRALVERTAAQLKTYDPYLYGEPDAEEEIDLREYWHLLLKRKWTILTVFVITLAIAATASFQKTPIYRATTVVQIDREAPKVLDFQGVTTGGTNYYDDGFYETQYELLKSHSLAEQVIDELHLADNPIFNPESADEPEQSEADRGTETDGTQPPADSSAAANRLVADFLGGLTIEPVRNSKLVAIHYDSPDPALAARIANALVDAFIHVSMTRRFEAASYAKSFLEERLKQIKAKLEDAEAELAAFERRQGIINLSEKETLTLAKLKAVNTALMTAESERIASESLYRQAAKSSGHGLSRILDNSVVNALKQTKVSLEADYQDRLRVFKPDYPDMVQLRSRLSKVTAEIAGEVAAIRSALRADYEADKGQEEMLRSEQAALKEAVVKLRDSKGEGNILLREVETNRIMYDGLLQRLKEVSVAAGVSMNNISVVDRASVPEDKFKPNTRLDLLLGALLGLFGGIGLAFLLEFLDDTIKLPEDLERAANLPVLGILPQIPKNHGGDDPMRAARMTLDEPRSAFAEAIRSLRTSLSFSTPAGAPKLLQITSAGKGAGKSTTALNLATAFTQMGRKVLLIDCDLRNPSQHKLLSVNTTKGLSHYLTGEAKPSEIAVYANVGTLFMIPAGPQPPNPAELLASPRMADLLAQAADKFDHVILDGPPTLGLADAIILANLVHGTLMIVEAGSTRKGHLSGALKRLNGVQATILGGALSKLSERQSAYSYYHSYYYYHTEETLPTANYPVRG